MKPNKPKQTEHDKWKKKELTNIEMTRNRCLSLHSFKRINTRAELKRHAGVSEDRIDIVTDAIVVSRQDVIDFFKSYETAIEAEYQRRIKPEAKPADKTVSIHPTDIDEHELKPVEAHEALPPCAMQKCFLFPFQERAARQILDNIVVHKKRGQLLRAAVGTGKTFIIGAVACRLIEAKFTEGKTYSPWAYAYITRASIVEQTERVLETMFSINTVTGVHVINIEQLRASFGELMVSCQTVVEFGEEHIKWKWKNFVHPCVIFLDECQSVKNEDSQQSRIMQAFNELTTETYQVYFSATPFLKVSQAKCFAVSTRVKVKIGLGEQTLTNENWTMFSSKIAAPSKPDEYSPPAVERLMTVLKDYIVDVKGVRPQFKAINSAELIDFRSDDEAKFVQQAWARYEAIMAKIKGYQLSASQSRFLILAQFTIYRKAAELAKADFFAEEAHAKIQQGYAVVLALGFKGTIRKVTKLMVEKFGYSRSQLSLIWGGGKTGPSKKQQAKMAVVNNEALQQVLRDCGLNLESLNLSDTEDYVEEEDDPTLRLGVQSLKQRQEEIDRFQSGKSLLAMFTFKAGGVGLSLHHTDEMTKVKCRRKKNGWVYVEDIPNIPTRPRYTISSTTFSAIELVQGLGRAARLTSLSDTVQRIVFYRNTVEERVHGIVSMALRCLRKVVRTKEDWESTIIGDYTKDDTKYVTNNVEQSMGEKPKKNAVMEEPEEDDDGGGMFFGDDEEEE